VNTAGGGDVTVELCGGQPELLNTVKEMATGNTMFTVALHSTTKVQLVPRKQHQWLLGSLQDTYTHKQVFLQRSEHRSNGPYYETLLIRKVDLLGDMKFALSRHEIILVM